jgi:CheY-like chemotaxis protein
MQAERFADVHPVINVLLIVAVLVLVTAALVFHGPIERALGRMTPGWSRGHADTATPPPPPSAGVLWVDDRPEHNARLLNGLKEQGVPIDMASSTNEALTHLRERSYAIVVSDMSRMEDGERVVDAGLRLHEQAGDSTPIVIFRRYAPASDAYRDKAIDSGAVAVVSSEAEIKDWLRTVNLL